MGIKREKGEIGFGQELLQSLLCCAGATFNEENPVGQWTDYIEGFSSQTSLFILLFTIFIWNHLKLRYEAQIIRKDIICDEKKSYSSWSFTILFLQSICVNAGSAFTLLYTRSWPASSFFNMFLEYNYFSRSSAILGHTFRSFRTLQLWLLVFCNFYAF